MRILFIVTGSQATFYATAPLATAARNAGHDVLLAAHEPWLETAEALGVPTVSFSSTPVRNFMRVGRSGNKLRFPKVLGDDEMVAVGQGFAKLAVASREAVLALANDWRPDLVVGSSMSYAAGLLAAEIGVPYVRQVEYLAIPMTGIDPGAEAELAPQLTDLGLPGLPEPDLVIDVTPPSIRPAVDHAAQPMRWIPSNPQRRLEPWMYLRPQGRKRVIVTSGFRSLMFRDPGWDMPRLVERLSAAGAEVLIAASPGAAERFGPQLGNARVGWIPVDVAAHTCDLAVHHGGGTTAMTFASAAVPQLIIPENPDEMPVNYHRKAIATALAGSGSARMLFPQREAPGASPADTIADACEDFFATTEYTSSAQTLCREIAGLPTPTEVAQKLDTLPIRV